MDKTNGVFQKKILNKIQHYNHKKYWKRRDYLLDSSKKNKLKKIFYLIYIKRIDAKHLSSFGSNINSGAIFETSPSLPHGPNLIFVSHQAKIGKNCVIYQGVTIGEKFDAGPAPMIGDNVVIYPHSIIIGDIKIGNNVKIGAGSIATKDVPDNCIVAGNPAQIIKMSE